MEDQSENLSFQPGAQRPPEYRAAVTKSGECQHMSVKPEKPGDYCIWSRWCMSACAEYVSFDGENWIDVSRSGEITVQEWDDDCETFYFTKGAPLGYHNYGAAPLPPKMDLQSRLERYKASKNV